MRLVPDRRFCCSSVLALVCAYPVAAPAPNFVMAPGLFRRAAAAKKQSTPTKKSTNRNEVGLAKLHKQTIDRIVEVLADRPEQAPLVLMALENGDYESTPTDESQFDPKMTKLSQVPKYWLAALMNQWQPKLTKAMMEGLDAAEPETIRRLVEFATGVDVKSWRLPRSALTKSVLSRTLTARYSAYGGRLNDKWLSAAVAGGTINWQGHGVYRWASAKEAAVKAIALESVNGSQAELPSDCSFSTAAAIQENWSDVRAALRAGWRPSADRALFKDTKYVSSSHPKVFELECNNFAEASAPAAGASGSGAAHSSSAPDGAAGVRGTTITEENTTIGQTRKRAKTPGFSLATASLVMTS